MNIHQKIAIATSGLILSLAGINTNPAQAAQFRNDFNFTIEGGVFSGRQGVGEFEYDDSDPEFIRAASPELQTPSGPGLIFNPSFVSSFSLKFLDETENYVNYPGDNTSIGVGVTGDSVKSFQTTKNNIGIVFRFLDDGTLQGVTSGNPSSISGNYIVVRESPSSVPEPANIIGLGIVGFSFLIKKGYKFRLS